MRTPESRIVFGPRPPSAVEWHTFVLLTVGYVAAVLCIAPWAREHGEAEPRMTAAIAGAILLASSGTALLLGRWYRDTGRLSMLALAAGHAYSAVMGALHLATFPGALFAQPLFGSEQTVGWLFLAWRGGLGIAYLTAVSLEVGAAQSTSARRGTHLWLACVAMLLLCGLLAFLAGMSSGESMQGPRWTTANRDLIWVWVAVHGAALLVVWLKRAFNDTLYWWLSLVLVAAITDLVLGNLGGQRYTLGWHASRASFVLSAYLLLAYLVSEHAGRQPHSRLPAFVAYEGAVSAACAAVYLRWMLEPWLSGTVPYATVYGAVAVSVWMGGWAPALLCAALGYGGLTVLFAEADSDARFLAGPQALQLGLFALSAALVIGLGEGLRRARNRYRESESNLREKQLQLTGELAETARLHALSTRLWSAADQDTALSDILDSAMAACQADFGNILVFDSHGGALRIAVQRGFSNDFIEHFRSVRIGDGSACAMALQTGARVSIYDVTLDAAYAPHRERAAAAGYRAVQATPLRIHNGTIVGMLCTHYRNPHTLSERETRLIDLYARHAADLIERLRFEEALRTADRRKDEFLATLAHELRNPLAPMRNAAAILGMPQVRPEQIDAARKILDRQMRHLVRLVDDLLDASRITLGKVQLHQERVSLSALMHEAAETVGSAVRAAGHELSVSLPGEPLVAQADATRIVQVFVNLLSNAIKFTAQGGKIWLSAHREGEEAIISVRDSGVGIDADHLESVFEMFSQATPALHRTEGGLGIGLAIVRGLVELHGGHVQAHSAGLDKGSEFVVRLPVSPAMPGSVAQEADETGPISLDSIQGKRVLVADDNRDVVATLRHYLELNGHVVREAYDGVESIQIASDFKPDVVLLDIGMPRMNGFEAAIEIRRRMAGHAVRIVAITGWGQDAFREQARRAGFDDHLTKPVEPALLLRMLSSTEASGPQRKADSGR